MTVNRISILLFALLVNTSCKDKNSFYTHTTKEDLYRLPLIEPYELINIYGSDNDRHEEAYSTWQVDLKYGHYPFSSARAVQVNVTNGIIYGWRPRTDQDVERRFVIIPKEKEEKVFKNQEPEWREYLKQKGIDSIKMYDVWTLFDEFRRNKILPWYNPQKGIYPYK